MIGAKHPDVSPLPLRFWAVSRFPNYIIAYLPDTKPLEVVAVLHGMRDLKNVLQGRGSP